MTSDVLTRLWMERYGEELPKGVELEPLLLKHKSVRSFTGQPLPEGWKEGLIAAAQSASTSSNLQLWSAVAVQDPDRREQIALLCADQNQVRTSSLFLAFCADHYRLRKAAEEQGMDPTGLSFNEMYTMAVVDAALAAERMAVAAESLGLGICYIGALRDKPEEVKELLHLPHGVVGLFGLAIGFPTEKVTDEVKPRIRQESVVFEEFYDQEVSTAEYDERMKLYYEAQGMKGDYTWSARSGRRVRADQLGVRQMFGPFVKAQGMDLE